MERDRKQIEKLVYLIAPFLLLWTTLCASTCYELGKHGIGDIDWMWVVQTNIPGIIISSSMLFYGHRKLRIFSNNKSD